MWVYSFFYYLVLFLICDAWVSGPYHRGFLTSNCLGRGSTLLCNLVTHLSHLQTILFMVFMDPGKYGVFGRRCNPLPVDSSNFFKLPWNNHTLSCHDSSTANEHADLALINQRIRDNLQALSNFNNAREEGR